MLKVMGEILGDVSNNISYFNKITFNGATVKEILVGEDVIAMGGVIPKIVSDLKDHGCEAIIDVFNNYPIMVNVLQGEKSLLMDGSSFFDTLFIPSSADTVICKFEMVDAEKSFQTLFCCREGGSRNTFTTFITNTGGSMRADFGNTYGSTMFSISPSIMYEYRMKAGLATLDDGQSKTIGSDEIEPKMPFVLGASYESYSTVSSYRNCMINNKYNTFAVLGDDNMYKLYLIAIEDNKMIDLVTGNIIINKGSGTASFV